MAAIVGWLPYIILLLGIVLYWLLSRPRNIYSENSRIEEYKDFRDGKKNVQYDDEGNSSPIIGRFFGSLVALIAMLYIVPQIYYEIDNTLSMMNTSVNPSDTYVIMRALPNLFYISLVVGSVLVLMQIMQLAMLGGKKNDD